MSRMTNTLAALAAVMVIAAPGYAAAPKKAKEVKPTPEMLAKGKAVFDTTCVVCHMKTGLGVPGTFPPLAKSDFLMADKKRSITIVTKGLQGPIVVNGKKYNQVMPPLPQLTDEQVAHVLTYVRNEWGNKGDAVTVEEVQEVRGTAKKAEATKASAKSGTGGSGPTK